LCSTFCRQAEGTKSAGIEPPVVVGKVEREVENSTFQIYQVYYGESQGQWLYLGVKFGGWKERAGEF